MLINQIIKKTRQAKFWRDKIIIFTFLVGFFINFYCWLNAFYIAKNLFIVKTQLEIPIAGLIILIVNYFFVYKFYEEKNNFLNNLIIICTLIIEAVFLISVL